LAAAQSLRWRRLGLLVCSAAILAALVNGLFAPRALAQEPGLAKDKGRVGQSRPLPGDATFRAARLRALQREGRRHREEGNYKKALDIAAEILRLAPGDRDALRLEQWAHEARLAASTLRGESPRRRQRTSDLMAEIERELKPPRPAQIILLPRGKGRKGGRRESASEPAKSELRAKLDKPITIEFQQTPLPEAIQQLATASGVNIILDPVSTPKVTTITMAPSRMPAESAIRWLGRFAGLRYCLSPGGVILTDRRGVQEPVQGVYNIAGLVRPPRDARGVRSGAADHSVLRRRADVGTDAVGRGWVQFIREAVSPGTWHGSSGLQEQRLGRIEYRNGRIVVVHTPDVHKQIQDLLDMFRREMNLQVHIQMRFIEISRVYLDSLELEHDYASTYGSTPSFPGNVKFPHDTYVAQISHDTQALELSRFGEFSKYSQADPDTGARTSYGLTASCTRISDELCDTILRAIVKERRGTVLWAPRITCFNTQRAVLQSLININYIRRVSADDEPEIGNVPSGIIFDVQPFVSGDRRYITLVLQPQIRTLIDMTTLMIRSRLGEFIIDEEGNLSPTYWARIVQTPTVQLFSMGTTVMVPNGGTLFVRGLVEVEEYSAESTVPFLGRLPLLRYLLRGWDRSEGRRSVIALVTAETVPDIFEE